jgi:ABC-type lipoprotein export system ATPase subunit
MGQKANTKTAGGQGAAAAAALIAARGLTRSYALGANLVVGVAGIDLAVNAGELVLLKGHSGSGKSTLLSLLAGLDRPTGGELVVAGHDLNRATPDQLTRFRREVVGVVFQSFNLLPTLTVLENVSLPALLAGRPFAATRRRAEELLVWLGMRGRLDHLPSQISGGEMQRTAIARAVVNDPAIVLADEPTGNLDSRSGQAVLELLVDLNRRWGRTVIMATHSTIADPAATRQIHLQDGRIVDPPS